MGASRTSRSQRNKASAIRLPGAAAAARSSAAPCVDAPMAAQRCLDAIAATRRASGRDDAAPLDPAAPATDLRATHHVGDRPRRDRAWNMTSASAREAMLRPDAVFSAAAPPARVDVSRPLDPLRCSDLSYHVMLFLCFARFIRLLFFFRRRRCVIPPLYWLQTTALLDRKKNARYQCCASLRVAFTAARQRRAAQHCSTAAYCCCRPPSC